MRILACLGSLAIAAGITLGAGSAAAEDAPKEYPECNKKRPTEGDTSAAKGAFQAGNASFNEADYERAINYWEDAYRRDCTAHPLLLNLARAYELSGQKRHAVIALQTFLTRSPNSSEEGQIRRRVEKLNEQIKAEDAAQASPAPSTTEPTPAPEATEPGPAPVSEPSPQESGKKRSVIPLVVAGGGGVLAVVGGIVFFGAQADISDFEKQCPNRQCPPGQESLVDDGNAARSRATVGGAIALVGLAAGIGGTIWYFTQPSGAASAGDTRRGFRAGVSPRMGYGYGGVNLVGEF